MKDTVLYSPVNQTHDKVLRIRRHLYCCVCRDEKHVDLVRLKMASGHEHIGWRCGNHWAAAWVGRHEALSIIRDHGTINELPWIKNEHDVQCAHLKCTRDDIEYHHFAPNELFDDAGDWPILPLCRTHHDTWHKTLKEAGLSTHWNKEVRDA